MAQAAAAAGAGLNAVGAIQQGNSNANVASYNAAIANQNAAIVQAQGAEQERLSRIQSGKAIGGEQASYGASGVTGDGSAMDVIRNSAANAELNALTIKNNSDIKATALKNEAALDYYRASNDQVAGYMNAASDLIGGTGKVMSMSGGGGKSSDSGVNGSDDSSAADDLAAEEDG